MIGYIIKCGIHKGFDVDVMTQHYLFHTGGELDKDGKGIAGQFL